MSFERMIIIFCVFCFAFVGIITIVDHQSLASSLGFSLQTPLAHSEIFAMYSGAQIGLAIFFAISYYRITWHRPALFAAACMLGSMALSRLVAVASVGIPETQGIIFFALEVGTTFIIILCLRSTKQQSRQKHTP